MAELDLIAPPKVITATFSLEPAYNVLTNLLLLNGAERTSGFSEWVYQTAAALSPERLRTNRLVLNALNAVGYLAGESWPNFPAWLDDLAARDPDAMRDRELSELAAKVSHTLGHEAPAPAQLLADRMTYLSLVERVLSHKDEAFDLALWEKAHSLLSDPPAMQDLIVTHLRTMWEEVVAPEWERNLSMLEESVAAFETLDFGGMSTAEVFRRVTERDLPTDWEKWPTEIKQIVFIPSAHIGPYLLLIHLGDKTARIAFGARIPEGASVRSPTLSRTELLMRLNALSDDTRLRILELLTREGELGAQDIMAHLDLSQSAASRHLHQLSASGYLTVRRHGGGNRYRLNHDRIDDTLDVVRKFLQ